MNAINNMGQVGFDKLASTYPNKPMGASASALKGSMETQEMVQKDISQMMKDVTPHLGHNLDVEA